MQDLTEGSVAKKIILFTIPLVLGSLFQLLYNFTDSVIVGQLLGVKELAGMGATGSLYFLLFGFANGLANGFSVVVARCFGSKDMKSLHCAIARSAVLSAVICIVLSAVSVGLLSHILNWIHVSDDLYPYADAYIRVILSCLAITIFYNLSAGILRSVGDSKTPLYFAIFCSLLNIVLDLFFIQVLKTGVAGAAWATVISQGLSLVLCVRLIFRKFRQIVPERQDFRRDKKMDTDLITSGLSLALQHSVIAVGSLMVQSAVNVMGTVAVAAVTASTRLRPLFMQPLGTLSTTMASFCGQNKGAGKTDRIKKGIRVTLIMCAIWSAISFGLSMLFGEQMVSVLVKASDANASEIIQMGAQMLQGQLLFFVFVGALFIFRSSLLAIGNKVMPTFSGVLEFAVKMVMALWVIPKEGFTAVIFTEPVSWVLCSVMMAIIFFRDPMYRKKDKNPGTASA